MQVNPLGRAHAPRSRPTRAGRLWMLQTRDAKRSAQAAVRIAVDLASARLITREEVVQRVKPEHVSYAA